MVLAGCAGGVAACHTPLRHRITCVGWDDGGSQALEFAMVLPLFGLLIALLLHAGLLLGDVIVAQGIAREVARTAVVEDRPAARDAARALAGGRDVRIELSDTGGLVEARIELHSSVFASTGIDVWLPARAVMRPEGAGGFVDG